MGATGGSPIAVSMNGREFPASADAEGQRKLGGWENEIEANGDGTARIVKTRVPWMLTGITIEIDDDRGDHEFVQDLADTKAYFPFTVELASGKVYQGTGQVTGEINFNTKNSTAGLAFGGQNKLTPQ